MKTKLTRLLSLILVVFMLVGCLAPLTACKPDGPDSPDACSHRDADDNGKCDECGEDFSDGDESTEGDGTATYTVRVTTQYGMVLSGVTVYVHEGTDPKVYNSVGRTRVDSTGKASFTLDSSKTYSVELDGVPEGYKVDERYTFDATKTADIKLASAPITDGSITDVDCYEVGDVIHDFTITDINGKEYTVSEVLKEQQLLVLNLWYVKCSACVAEFPYMIKAYESYNELHGNDGKNIVEIFAINDHNDAIGSIRDFTVNIPNEDGTYTPSGLTFPTFKAEDSGFGSYELLRAFFEDDSATGYPVSAFIDRSGVICCIEVGAVTNAKAFTNAFDHFTAADYEQKLVNSIAEFTPVTRPNTSGSSMDEISDALTGNYRDTEDKLDVTYYLDKDEYNWPYIVTTLGTDTCVRPTNKDVDNSFAILYAKVFLEAGDALAFDYFSSTQSTADGAMDRMVLIVDGKDIYTIAGKGNLPADNESADWATCYTYVAQNTGYYELAFCYLKDDADYVGEDAVFIKNLRAVDSSEIDTETYIFRYAATNPNDNGNGFNNYVNVVLSSKDGYYHVGSEDGPLLLAQLVDTYTQFDSSKTVFERLYTITDDYGENYFIVNGVDVFKQFEKYGNYASNSDMPGLCPVTEELMTYLQAYCEYFRLDVGESASDNLWLQLCCYYDAYGHGVTQKEDPIKGLATFSAYEAVLDQPNTVTYNQIVVPRGYLYKFVPTTSGVYRITSDADSLVVGWIFQSNVPADSFIAGDRIQLADTNEAERIVFELVFEGYKVTCPVCHEDTIWEKEFDSDGNEIVITEIECQNPDCMDEDRYATVITDLSSKETVHSIDHNNVSMLEYLEAGEAYYIAIAFHTVEELGSFEFTMSYVGEEFDKFVTVSPGPFTYIEGTDGSVGELIAGGVDVKFCDVDGCHDCAEVALAMGDAEGTKYYHAVNSDGSLGYVVFADLYRYTSTFPTQNVQDLLDLGAFNFTDAPAKSALDELAESYYKTMILKGQEALYSDWQAAYGYDDDYCDEIWVTHSMSYVIKGDTEELTLTEEQLAQALEWAEYVINEGKSYLMSVWGAEYESNWEYYQMDDIMNGIYHGDNGDYSDIIQGYIDRMLDESGHPERQGCVAVTEELAYILQILMEKEVFENVENAWVKLCYYYKHLGPTNN